MKNFDFTSISKRSSQNIYESPRNFPYIINPEMDICNPNNKDSKILLIAAVSSSSKNFNMRQSIRATWANQSYFNKIKIAFILGNSGNESINRMIRRESENHGDIVQVNFLDTYDNLTLKTLQIMRWTAEYCANARFVIKIDDDMIMNSKKVYQYLKNIEANASNKFFCHVLMKKNPNRNLTLKYYMPEEIYPHNYYPKYCKGGAYIFTQDLSAKLLNSSLNHKLLFLEDVSMGILAEQLNSSFVNLASRFVYPNSIEDYAKNGTNKDFLFLLTFKSPTPNRFKEVWNYFFNKILD